MHTTAEAVVEALGGTSAVAALLGLPLPVVSNWKARGNIPPAFFVALSEALAKLQMEADPAVFKMKSVSEAAE